MARHHFQSREEERAYYTTMRKRSLHRWNTDRADVLDEYTVMCPFCESLLTPRILDRVSGQWLQESTYDQATDIMVIRRSSCGCEQEQEAIAAQLETERQLKQERRNAAWAWALERSGLVKSLAVASFENYNANGAEQADRLRKCKAFARMMIGEKLSDRPWLVLYGKNGTGKTHLAAAVVREALGNGWHGCYFRPWLSYLRRLMDSFDPDSTEKTADIARELASGRLVVIDDIDNDRSNVSNSGFAETELFRALDERYRAALPTVLTFNRKPLEMLPWLGTSGVDRMIHYSYAMVEFTGDSYRSGQVW